MSVLSAIPFLTLRKAFLCSLILLLAFAAPFSGSAQSYAAQWMNRLGSTSNDQGKSVAKDPSGNYYIASDFAGTVTAGSTTYTSRGGYDILLTKYNNSGQLQWSIQLGGNADDAATHIFCDSLGYLYFTGTFLGNTFDYPGGSLTNTNPTRYEIFLLRIGQDGAIYWAQNPKGTGNDYSSKVYSNGKSVFLTGNFQSIALQVGSITINNPGFRSVLLASIDSSGSTNWVKAYGGTNVDRGLGIHLDRNSNIYLGGNIGSLSLNFGNGVTITGPTVPGQYDIFLTKFDPAGNALWSRTASGTAIEELTDLETDESGNTWITGYFKSTALSFGSAVLNNPAALEQLFIARYDTNGNLSWAKKTANDVQSRATDLSLVGPTHAFLTGYYSGGSVQFNQLLTNSGGLDAFLVQYNDAGDPVWSDKAGGTGDDRANALEGSLCGALITGGFKSALLSSGTLNLTNPDPTSFDVFNTLFSTTFSYQLPVDTLRACGSTAVLDAGTGYNSYNWNTGENTEQIIADISGTYKVKVYNSLGCYAEDQVYVSLVLADILNPDTVICKGSTINLFIDSSFIKGRLGYTGSKPMNAYWTIGLSPVPDERIRMVVDGSWKPTNWVGQALDPAFLYNNTANTVIRPWVYPADQPAPFLVNGTALRPTLDLYRADHQYEYNFITSSTNLNIIFTDPAVYTDNTGSLQFSLYEMNNPVTVSWSTGQSSNSIQVQPLVTTKYYVTITDGITVCKDSILVTVEDAPNLILPDTLNVCGDSVELDAGAGAATYSWSTGASSQKIIVRATGKYYVTGANALGCTRLDSVFVSMAKADILQQDTTICKNAPVALTAASSPASTYSWSNGATGSNTSVTPLVSTQYYLQVSNAYHSCKDSIQITVLDLPQPSLPDTVKYCGPAVTLDAGSGFSAYTWSTGASTPTISVSASGKYYVDVTGSAVCSNRDSVYVSLIDVNLVQADTAICTKSSITLTATAGPVNQFTWSTGATGAAVTVTPVANTKYYVTASDGIHSCRDSVQVNLLALPQPVLNDSVKVCGTSVELDAGPGFASYSWSTGAGSPKITVTQSGKYYVDVTGANTCTNRDSSFVALLRADILQADTSICTNASLPLTAFTAPGYQYSWSTGAVTPAITVVPANTTKYFLSVSNSYLSCKDSIAVTVRPLPQPMLPDTLKTCMPTQLLDAGAGFTSYQWSSGATTAQITANARGKYRVQVTDNTGCSNTDSVWVAMVKADILQADTTICKGSVLSLAAFTDPAYTYRWSTGATSTTILVQPAAPLKYYLNTSDGTQTCTDSVAITFHSIDTAVAVAGPLSFCAGQSVQLQAKPGYTYSWTRNGIPVPGAATAILVVTQSGNYKAFLTNANGCTDSSNARTITVNTLPLVSLNSSSQAGVCSGSAFVFSAVVTPNAGGSVQYQWLLNGNPISGATASSYSAGSGGLYTVQVTNSNGCSQISAGTTLAINAIPSLSFPGGTTVGICNGAAAQLQAQVTAGSGTVAALQWYRNGTAITGAINTSYTATQAGNYTLQVTNSNGCSAVSVPVTVAVSSLPVAVLTPPVVTKICRGVYTTLTASGGNTYEWYLNGQLISGANSATYDASNAGTYTVKALNAAGCSAMAPNAVTLSVIEVPQPDFSEMVKCAGSVSSFTNHTVTDPADQVNYSWSMGDGASYPSTNVTHTFSKGGTYPVRLSAASTACPFAPVSTVKLVTIEQPRAGIRYEALNAVAGKPLQLQARTFASQYNWSPANGLNTSSSPAPVAVLNAPQTYTITLTTATGCVTVDTLLVRLFQEREIYVPTAFTPNGDGKNDRLYPLLVGMSSLQYFKVYNRWGNLVFETSSASPASGWDGNWKGVMQPMETYVWVAAGTDIDGKPVKRNGSVLLIR